MEIQVCTSVKDCIGRPAMIPQNLVIFLSDLRGGECQRVGIGSKQNIDVITSQVGYGKMLSRSRRRDANPLKIAGPQLGVNYLNLAHSREDVELTCGTVLSLNRDGSGNQGVLL
jgi:hypothetical protein